jgi:hypothetical protein
MANVASEGLAFDVLLTNLGQRTIPAVYRNFRLHAVWGPCVATGFVHDQAIGVITVGDRLRLVHTSYDPVPGLLEHVMATLESECEPEYDDSHFDSCLDTPSRTPRRMTRHDALRMAEVEPLRA